MKEFEKNVGTNNNDKVCTEVACPNCWGVQEYEGQELRAVEKLNINLNNIVQKKGWIEGYVARNLLKMIP